MDHLFKASLVYIGRIQKLYLYGGDGEGLRVKLSKFFMKMCV